MFQNNLSYKNYSSLFLLLSTSKMAKVYVEIFSTRHFDLFGNRIDVDISSGLLPRRFNSK